MSLEAPWVSTIFGAMVITGEAMATFAAMIVVTAFLASARPMSEIATPEQAQRPGKPAAGVRDAVGLHVVLPVLDRVERQLDRRDSLVS